jgi:hypothetical protein
MADEPIPTPPVQQWVYRLADGRLLRGGYGRHVFDAATEGELLADTYVDPIADGIDTVDGLTDAIAAAAAEEATMRTMPEGELARAAGRRAARRPIVNP